MRFIKSSISLTLEIAVPLSAGEAQEYPLGHLSEAESADHVAELRKTFDDEYSKKGATVREMSATFEVVEV